MLLNNNKIEKNLRNKIKKNLYTKDNIPLFHHDDFTLYIVYMDLDSVRNQCSVKK